MCKLRFATVVDRFKAPFFSVVCKKEYIIQRFRNFSLSVSEKCLILISFHSLIRKQKSKPLIEVVQDPSGDNVPA